MVATSWWRHDAFEPAAVRADKSAGRQRAASVFHTDDPADPVRLCLHDRYPVHAPMTERAFSNLLG